LKRRGDTGGTGAKYTLIHVDRSIEFAGELMLGQDFPVEEILAVQNMIRCTGVNVKLESIQFQDDLERIVGFSARHGGFAGANGGARLRGQTADSLLEFAEAAKYSVDGKMKAGGFFSSADDLMQKTPLFWENYVQSKINRDFLGLYPLSQRSLSRRPQSLHRRIEANMARLRRELAAGPADVTPSSSLLNGRLRFFACRASTFYNPSARQSIYAD
jgi:hypothetical protein